VSRRVRPSQVTVLALLLYSAFIVYQSLAHGGAWRCSADVLAVTSRVSRTDILANVVAYVPLGLLCVLAATRAVRWRTASPPPASVIVVSLGSVAVSALLSLSLELVQACQAGRVSSVFDLIANVAGGAFGVAAGLVFHSLSVGIAADAGVHDQTRGATHERRLRLLTGAVAALWALSQASPWVFAVDLGTIRSHLAFLRHWSDGPSLDAWRVVRHTGAWVAAACACRLAARSRGAAIAGLLTTLGVSFVLQVLLDVAAPLSFEELAGVVAAVIVVVPAMAVAGGEPSRKRWSAGLMLGAVTTVAAYQLRPDAGPVQAFSWWPRVGLGGMRGALDYALLFGWFGLAAAVAGRWAEAGRTRPIRRAWPASAVVITMLFEAAQTRIPGRGPDISAPLFTLLAVLLTAALLADGQRPAD
jgi:VanZ family protein